MGISKVNIEDFLILSKQFPMLDVRSPGEFGHAHIPGAYNIPLFSDEERKIVGTIYKTDGRQPAIKAGLNSFGPKMNAIISEAEMISQRGPKSTTLLVHCWRGGMRSAGIAWLLDLYGFKVYTLNGGYKAFRNWALQQFEAPLAYKVLGGYTGSGKTKLIWKLRENGATVLDLEKLACHKGSAFGGRPELQPTQEMFENELATAIYTASKSISGADCIWLEDESQRIGNLNLPPAFWKIIRKCPLFFIEVPFEERLQNIIEEYGVYEKEYLKACILRIQKRLGQDSKACIEYLEEGSIRESFGILLKYYDKLYKKGLIERQGNEIIFGKSDDVLNRRNGNVKALI